MPTHSLFFPQWPSSDLSSFVVDWETFLWVLKTEGAAWKSEAQARIAPNVNLNGGGEFRAWEALTHLLTERVRITQWPWSNHRLILWRVEHMFGFFILFPILPILLNVDTHTWTRLLRVYVFKAKSTCAFTTDQVYKEIRVCVYLCSRFLLHVSLSFFAQFV